METLRQISQEELAAIEAAAIELNGAFEGLARVADGHHPTEIPRHLIALIAKRAATLSGEIVDIVASHQAPVSNAPGQRGSLSAVGCEAA
jgi:hypothetical protein